MEQAAVAAENGAAASVSAYGFAARGKTIKLKQSEAGASAVTSIINAACQYKPNWLDKSRKKAAAGFIILLNLDFLKKNVNYKSTTEHCSPCPLWFNLY